MGTIIPYQYQLCGAVLSHRTQHFIRGKGYETLSEHYRLLYSYMTIIQLIYPNIRYKDNVHYY